MHDYGDACQSVTEIAVETHAPIDADDFRTLNRCLDDAIADASRPTGLNATNPLLPTRVLVNTHGSVSLLTNSGTCSR